MPELQSEFERVWVDALAAEAAALELQRVERCYRRALAVTDDVLAKLEWRNLNGQRELDVAVRRDLARTLTELPPDARDRFPGAGTVQEALDGIFLVQEPLLLVLQRRLHWDRMLLAHPDDDVETETELASRTA